MKSRMQEESKDEIETEDYIPYNEIDKLQNMGINAADLTKLKTAGIFLSFPSFSQVLIRILHSHVTSYGNSKGSLERERNL